MKLSDLKQRAAPDTRGGGNDPAAQTELAVRYLEGLGVRQSFERAVQWARRAAEQGYKPGKLRYAEFVDAGLGIAKDKAWAFMACAETLCGWTDPEGKRDRRIGRILLADALIESRSVKLFERAGAVIELRDGTGISLSTNMTVQALARDFMISASTLFSAKRSMATDDRALAMAFLDELFGQAKVEGSPDAGLRLSFPDRSELTITRSGQKPYRPTPPPDLIN